MGAFFASGGDSFSGQAIQDIGSDTGLVHYWSGGNPPRAIEWAVLKIYDTVTGNASNSEIKDFNISSFYIYNNSGGDIEITVNGYDGSKSEEYDDFMEEYFYPYDKGIATITHTQTIPNGVWTQVTLTGFNNISWVEMTTTSNVLMYVNRFNINAVSSNATPVIDEGDTALEKTTDEDTALTEFTLNATDSNSGDTLTWSISSAASHGTASVSQTPTGNQQTINYSPNGNYSGSDSFTVQVSDGTATDTIVINVTVTAVNDAPTWSLENNTTNEDEALDLNLSHYISDPDSSSFTFTAESNNTDLADVAISGAMLTITPQSDQNGLITVTVYGSDGEHNVSSSFTFTITAVDDAPQLVTISNPSAVDEDFDDFNITLSANDAEGNAFGFSARSNDTSKATVTVNGDQMQISAVANAFGSVSFDVTVTQENNSSLSDTQTFTLTINPVNDAPLITTVFKDINVITSNFGPLMLDVNLSDVEGSDLNLTVRSSNTRFAQVTQNWSDLIEAADYVDTLDFNLTGTANRIGGTRITLTVSDGDRNSSKSFSVHTPINPSILMYLLN